MLAVRFHIRRRNVDRESLAATRKMQTAETMEDNLSQKKTEKSEACGSLDVCRPGCRSKFWALADERDELSSSSGWVVFVSVVCMLHGCGGVVTSGVV